MNVIKLKIDIEQNLRFHLMNEIFDKGNYLYFRCIFLCKYYQQSGCKFYSAILEMVTNFCLFNLSIKDKYSNCINFLLGDVDTDFPTIYLTKLGRKYHTNI